MLKIDIYPTGDNSLMVQGLGEKILLFQELLQKELAEYIVDFIPAYQKLLVIYHLNAITYEQLAKEIQLLRKTYQKKLYAFPKNKNKKTIIIPSYYDTEVGWDLEQLAQGKKISISEIIHWHTSVDYQVLAIGFIPGFAYLSGVPENLHLPRRKNARICVPQGSVAIANHQSTIYPKDSAGGWNIIGKTYLPMIDWEKKYPCLLQIGDVVKFESISKQEFLQKGGKIVIEKSEWHSKLPKQVLEV